MYHIMTFVVFGTIWINWIELNWTENCSNLLLMFKPYWMFEGKWFLFPSFELSTKHTVNWRQRRKESWRILDDAGVTVTWSPRGKAVRAGTGPVMNLIRGVRSMQAVNSLLTHQQHWELITVMPQFDLLRLNHQLCYKSTVFLFWWTFHVLEEIWNM